MKDKKFTQKETILKQLAKKIEELVNSIKEDKAKKCECK